MLPKKSRRPANSLWSAGRRGYVSGVKLSTGSHSPQPARTARSAAAMGSESTGCSPLPRPWSSPDPSAWAFPSAACRSWPEGRRPPAGRRSCHTERRNNRARRTAVRRTAMMSASAAVPATAGIAARSGHGCAAATAGRGDCRRGRNRRRNGCGNGCGNWSGSRGADTPSRSGGRRGAAIGGGLAAAAAPRAPQRRGGRECGHRYQLVRGDRRSRSRGPERERRCNRRGLGPSQARGRRPRPGWMT